MSGSEWSLNIIKRMRKLYVICDNTIKSLLE